MVSISEYMKNDQMKKMLSFDALDTAEKLTGTSYKEDDFTSLIGMSLMLEHNKKKEEMLKAEQDSYYGISMSSFRQIVESMGFVLVHEHGVEDIDHPGNKFYLYYHPEKYIVLVCDTYYENSVNSCNFYYNWEPSSEDWYKYTSSGGFDFSDKKTWIGHHDGREAIKFNVEMLEKNGKFVKWVDSGLVWLVDYQESRSGDREIRKEIIQSRLKLVTDKFDLFMK